MASYNILTKYTMASYNIAMNNKIDFEQILYRYNPWWEGQFKLDNIINRKKVLDKLKINLSTSQIVMLSGLRRIGKTTLMKCMIKYLLDINVNPKHIFYISLDDYLLSNESLLEIIDIYRIIHKISFDEKIYLFLDEITNQKDFEIQLKNIYDQGNAKVYASSSSASILKNKKAFLTGRNTVIEILPLDFEEYLTFKKINIKKSNNKLLQAYFEDFMQKGGIPEYVLTDNIEYLKKLIDDIIQKDIANFYGVKDTQLLKDFFLLLMERSGKIVSINKIAKILSISPDSAKRYLNMFKNTYLVYLVQRAGKTNERLLSAKKIYAPDLGIRCLFTGFRDKGSLFENYVYFKIKDKNPSYIYEEGNEIDFITEDKTLIEVKYNSEMSIKQNELFNSIKAKKKIIVKDIFDLEKLN